MEALNGKFLLRKSPLSMNSLLRTPKDIRRVAVPSQGGRLAMLRNGCTKIIADSSTSGGPLVL